MGSLARASICLLLALGCRRAAVVAKEDPAPVDAAPKLAEDPLLVHGKVVDLKTFKVVHHLVSQMPLAEYAAGELGWVVARGGVVEGYELTTGKRRFATAARCGSMSRWDRRTVCRQDDQLHIIDENGDTRSAKIGGGPWNYDLLATTILVRHGAGLAHIYDSQAKLVASHPSVGVFDSVTPDGDGYCIFRYAMDFELECRKSDGAIRLEKAIPFPLPLAPSTSGSGDHVENFVLLNRRDGKTSGSVVLRLTDGKQIALASPEVSVLVTDPAGAAMGLLRTSAALELLDLTGKSLWRSSAYRPTRALVRDDVMFLVETDLVAALRWKDGATIWERRLDKLEVDGGYMHIGTRFKLRGSLLHVTTEVGTYGNMTAGRLVLLDALTGKELFRDVAQYLGEWPLYIGRPHGKPEQVITLRSGGGLPRAVALEERRIERRGNGLLAWPGPLAMWRSARIDHEDGRGVERRSRRRWNGELRLGRPGRLLPQRGMLLGWNPAVAPQRLDERCDDRAGGAQRSVARDDEVEVVAAHRLSLAEG